MKKINAGAKLGGEEYRKIIFFEKKRNFKKFTSGKFEFGAQAKDVAINAGASDAATNNGSADGASITHNFTKNVASTCHGMTIFTVDKGGMMYEASIGGMKFNYKKR